ncbi:MAG: anti-sigma factor [Synechococcus sp.]
MRQRPTNHLSDQEWERLSAYIDGEVTTVERAQIEYKLTNDASYQHAYSCLLHLQDGFARLPLPSPQDRSCMSADEMAETVLQRLEKAPLSGAISPTGARRWARLAAGVIVLVSAGSLVWRIGQPSRPKLLISLDEPPFDIPTEIVTPELTSTHKAESYLLSPGTMDDAYSILLTDI